VLVTIDELDACCTAALFDKAVCTKKGGHQVLVLMSTKREWKALRSLGAAGVLLSADICRYLPISADICRYLKGLYPAISSCIQLYPATSS
tara:strand:- start:136 stop:408 length:273 start_codon:yes stop_codon:yes gene_type:complete